jgi:hypothetical protein
MIAEGDKWSHMIAGNKWSHMIAEGETNVEDFGRKEKFIQGFGRET